MGNVLHAALVFECRIDEEESSRTDDEESRLGKLVREIDKSGCVRYRIRGTPPPIPRKVTPPPPPKREESGKEDDVFIDLSSLNPLLQIQHVIFIHYFFSRGIGVIEAFIIYSREYGEKLLEEITSRNPNCITIAGDYIADDIWFEDGKNILSCFISEISLFEKKGNTVCFKIKMQTRNETNSRRQKNMMKSKELICTFYLKNGTRCFTAEELKI